MIFNILQQIAAINASRILFAPNLKKIPNHATTHYVQDIYPYVHKASIKSAQKINIKPSAQRKTLKANKSDEIIDAPGAAPIATPDNKARKSIVKPKALHRKLRKVNKKAALADHFDNYKDSDAVLQAKQEWLNSVVRDLDKIDHEKNLKIEKQHIAALYFAIDLKPNSEEIMDWGEDIKLEYEYKEDYNNYLQLLDENLEDWIQEAEYTANQDEMDINEYLAKFDAKEAAEIAVEIAAKKATQKKQQTIKSINEFVTDRFIRKYGDNRDTMRALNKTRDSRNARLEHLLKDLQITK